MSNWTEEQEDRRVYSTCRKFLLIGILIFVIGFFLVNVKQVDTGELAVVTRFGDIVGVQSVGLYLKSPLEVYHKIDTTQQQIEEIYYTATKDTQSIDQQIVTQIQVDPTKAAELYERFLGNHIDAIVKPILYDGFKSATANYTLENAIAQRAALGIDMTENVRARLEPYGIHVYSAEIKDVQIPTEYAAAVEQKKIAEQELLRAEIEKQQAILISEQKLEVAKRDAEARKLEATINEEISETLTDEILRKMYLDKWNGQLPMYISGNDSTFSMLLPANNNQVYPVN